MKQIAFLNNISNTYGLTYRKYKTAYQKKVGGYSIIVDGEDFEILIRCRQKYRKFRNVWVELYIDKKELHFATPEEVENSDIPDYHKQILLEILNFEHFK